MGVSCQISGRSKPLEDSAKPCEVRIGWLRDMDVRQFEPTMNSFHDVADAQRTRDNPSIGCGADEAQ